MKLSSKLTWFASLLGLVLVSYFYRYIRVQTPFWVDEFSTANQALLFLNHGFGAWILPNTYIEFHNITTHILVAVSFGLFGVTEQVARLPFILIGSLVPALVAVLGYQVSRRRSTGVAAGLLAALSYQQIVWSQQARGYMVQQVLILSSILLYLQLREDKTRKPYYVAALFLLSILGVLTHITFLLVLGALLLDFLVIQLRFHFRKARAKNAHKQKAVSKFAVQLVLSGLLTIFGVIWLSGGLEQVTSNILQVFSLGLVQNVGYYHAFLWRHHGVITALAGIGFVLHLHSSKLRPLLLVLGTYYAFLFFVFAPFTIRYLMPVFPVVLVGVTLSLQLVTKQLLQMHFFKKYTKSPWFFPVGVVLSTVVLIANGYVFVPKPKPYYSVNHFMREVALVEYDRVYEIILSKSEQVEAPVAVLETWKARAQWYLGQEYPDVFFFRWLDDPSGLTNGLTRSTPVLEENTTLPTVQGAGDTKLVSSLADLEMVLNQYHYGFLWVDDSTLPRDVIEYAEEHFLVELELEKHPLDDNPVSSWPGKLYSWGFDDS